jgi:hypothetical protein
MDFYLSIDGEKQGPFSIFKVGDLYENGTITEDTLAWHRDLDGWEPISKIASLETLNERHRPVSKPPPIPEVTETIPHHAELDAAPLPRVTVIDTRPQSRPFLRFWARMFDYTAVTVMVYQISDFNIPQPAPNELVSDFFNRYLAEMQGPEAILMARTLFFSFLGWHLVETVLIHLFGTTPGKALFGIKVRSKEGGPLTMLTSLGRSFYVYVMGVGFLQFPFILIGMVFSYFRIQATGESFWDQHLKIKVETTPLGVVRIGFAVFAFFVLLMLQSVKF